MVMGENEEVGCLWFVVHEFWFVVRRLWFVVCDLWLWFVVCDMCRIRSAVPLSWVGGEQSYTVDD